MDSQKQAQITALALQDAAKTVNRAAEQTAKKLARLASPSQARCPHCGLTQEISAGQTTICTDCGKPISR